MTEKKKNTAGKLVKALPSFLATMAAAVFSPLFLFFQNAGEAHFGDVAPTMLMFMAVGAVLFAAALLLTRSHAKAGLISVAFLLVFLNYANIENAIRTLLPYLRYWHIAPILFVLLLHIGWLIHKFLPSDISEMIASVLAAVFAGLIVLNGLMAVPDIAGRMASEKEMRTLNNYDSVDSEKEMPNIYFLMFDEYSSYDFMLKYYDYDNVQMMDKLEKYGFSISRTSHNESISTTTVVPNLMNLDYIVNDSVPEYDKALAWKNAALYPLLAENGYSLYSLTEKYGLPMLDDSQQKTAAATVSGDTLEDLLLKGSVAYPLVKTRQGGLGPTINTVENFIKSGEKNRFLAAHFNITHAPFMYDQDGNISKNINSNWEDKQFYLNTYIYASKVITNLVECIMENDPDSIIILQSDHGARASTDSNLFMVMFTMEDMSNVLNCVYYRGEKLDIEGLSGVNTHRLVYSKLLNMDLPPVEVPPLQG